MKLEIRTENLDPENLLIDDVINIIKKKSKKAKKEKQKIKEEKSWLKKQKP